MSIDPTVWTDERIDRLKTLWAEGYSAAVIAERLPGGFSRSAILGKVHRLKLTKRRTKHNQPQTNFGKPRKARQTYAAKPLPVEQPCADPKNPQTILSVAGGQCRWPIDDPSLAMRLCGEPTCSRNGEASVYCAGHAAKAYMGRSPRKRIEPVQDYVPAGNRRFNFRAEFV